MPREENRTQSQQRRAERRLAEQELESRHMREELERLNRLIIINQETLAVPQLLVPAGTEIHTPPNGLSYTIPTDGVYRVDYTIDTNRFADIQPVDLSGVNELFRSTYQANLYNTATYGNTLMDLVHGTKTKSKKEFKDTMDKETYELETMGYRQG